MKMIICRVCLDKSEKLIPLTADNSDARSIVHMLNEFTIISAEQKLPKYICEECAGQLDIAYSFKRKYEDSTVKFIRQTTYREETEVASTAQSSETHSQNELETALMDYTGDSSVDRKFNINVVDTKTSPSFTTSANERPMNDDPEGSNFDENGFKTEHELDGNFDTNPNWNGIDADLVESDSSDGSVHEVLDEHQAVEEPQTSEIYQQNIIIHSVESHYVSDVESSNGKPDDEMPDQLEFNPSVCDTEPTNQPNKIEKENKPETESQSSMPNFFSSKIAIETNLKTTTATSNWRALRSGHCLPRLIDLQEQTLPRSILNKIYTYHYGHGSKPYKCDVCYRRFKTKGHIKAHRVRHIEAQKRIRCSRCQLTFLTKPHFKNHRCSINLKGEVKDCARDTSKN